MNDDNKEIIEQKFNASNDNNISATNIESPNKNLSPAVENNDLGKKDNPADDVTKVKIRDILKQRFKNMRPALKKAIPLILVGIICFAAGVGVDRAFAGRRFGKNLINRPGYNQASPNNRFNRQQGDTNTNPKMNNKPNRKS